MLLVGIGWSDPGIACAGPRSITAAFPLSPVSSWVSVVAPSCPTEHVVKILDVRPPREERHPYDPYFLAVCSADDCGWVSAPIGRDEAHPDPEQSVRAEAATHSSTMTGPRRPLG
jgi:hypothetical protein